MTPRLSAEERSKELLATLVNYLTDIPLKESLQAESILAHAIKQAEQSIFERTKQQCIEWCMAFCTDDGTSQKIEEKLKAIRLEDL